MIEISYFKKKLNDVSLSDLCAVFPMTAALVVSPFFRKKYKNTWLICEENKEARDNGYHFFKYMCLEQPQQDCCYAISPECSDWNKISQLGKAIPYGSIKHWILYFTSRYNISSQKGGKPNAALCSFFELNGLFKPHNVFLQHGVTKDRNDWLMAERCRFDFFITATTSEHEFVKRAFGYSPSIVQYTGFPRFDNLHNNETIKNRIIIMPTWRKWLKLRSEKNEQLGDVFETSNFLKKWIDFLNSYELSSLIDRYQLEIIFYPHRGMQNYISSFQAINKKIIVASVQNYDIQQLLKSAQLLITDYSSVYFDMFYMKKPVIFYQFDEVDFRKYHYETGWFDYHNNPFATSYSDYLNVINAMEQFIRNGYQLSEQFYEAHKKEFVLYDQMNSARIYRLLASKL